MAIVTVYKHLNKKSNCQCIPHLDALKVVFCLAPYMWTVPNQTITCNEIVRNVTKLSDMHHFYVEQKYRPPSPTNLDLFLDIKAGINCLSTVGRGASRIVTSDMLISDESSPWFTIQKIWWKAWHYPHILPKDAYSSRSDQSLQLLKCHFLSQNPEFRTSPEYFHHCIDEN